MNRTRLVALPAALLFALALPAQEKLELGKMWTFENAPLEHLEKAHGFKPPEGWFDQVRLSSLRIPGCSASFVSPKGLIMTNHHCVRDAVARVSPRDQDWVKNGFAAKSPAEEVKIPGMDARQLASMEDVTARVDEGIPAGADDATVAKMRAENEKKILDAAKAKNPDFEYQVVRLFQGAQAQLYAYKVYRDVRLVAAPHLQSAHFGGDPDNFTYPRYGIDFSFLRAYEDDKPADSSKHYFRWSATGAKEGELVFVTGNPGNTGRLLTYAQLEYLRDQQLPIRLGQIDSTLVILKRAAAQSPQIERQLRTQILGMENSQKAIRGYHNGLLDAKLMAAKKVAEEAFRSRIDAQPDLKKKFGDAWDKLAAVQKDRMAMTPSLAFHTPGGNNLIARALNVVRAVDPNTAKEAAEQARKDALADLRPSNPIQEALFVDFLARAQKWLPKNDPYLNALLRGKAPAEAAKALRADSKLDERAAVEALLDGGAEAVKASDDPVIAAARILAPIVEKNQKADAAARTAESVQATRIGQALFAAYGTKVSPDATFTLRLSDGVVQGFPYNGTIAPWRTSFYGLYGRNVEFENKYPFDLPQPWLDKKDKVDMTKSVNFVSTNDIIGGNSGSPVINKDREIVGLIFDGNIEMLANNYLYRDDVPRAVSVHVDAIVTTLKVIFEADWIVEELQGNAGN
ncbi:MAG: S46 family peptidase [Planctomycetes bacterium]|nr:S46 family peptidase [Planctomycetota bacterium]